MNQAPTLTSFAARQGGASVTLGGWSPLTW